MIELQITETAAGRRVAIAGAVTELGIVESVWARAAGGERP